VEVQSFASHWSRHKGICENLGSWRAKYFCGGDIQICETILCKDNTSFTGIECDIVEGTTNEYSFYFG